MLAKKNTSTTIELKWYWPVQLRPDRARNKNMWASRLVSRKRLTEPYLLSFFNIREAEKKNYPANNVNFFSTICWNSLGPFVGSGPWKICTLCPSFLSGLVLAAEKVSAVPKFNLFLHLHQKGVNFGFFSYFYCVLSGIKVVR